MLSKNLFQLWEQINGESPGNKVHTMWDLIIKAVREGGSPGIHLPVYTKRIFSDYLRTEREGRPAAASK